MASLSGLVRRLRGDHIVALRTEVAGLNDQVARINEVLLQMNHVVVHLDEVIATLNHDVRAGAEPALPLFLGHAERLRLDADTAVAATQVIERQLALLADQVAALDANTSSGD